MLPKRGKNWLRPAIPEGDSVAFMLGLCYKVNALISSQDTTDYLSDINTIKVMYPAFKKNGNKEAAAKWHRHWEIQSSGSQRIFTITSILP